MITKVLTSTALATILATGAFAQTAEEPATGADTEIEGDAPVGAEPLPEGTAGDDASDPVTAEDPATEADPMTAEDPATEADPMTAEDPATEADPMTAEDPATEADPMTAEDPAATGTGDMTAESDYPLEDGWERVDAAGLSADELMGEDIVNMEDETIATIDDILVTDAGDVESIVARFGGFLGFGSDRVLLEMDEIDVIRDEDDNLVVRSNLTPEALEGRPAYEG